MNKETFLTLYKSLARPYLEYGSCVWTTTYKTKRVKIENILRRATKLLPELEDKSYSERLKILGLPSLGYRRHRTDMIQTYKIFKNIDKVDRNKIFKQYETSIMPTRGHKFKIFKPYSNS